MTIAMAAPYPDLPTLTTSQLSGREVQLAESIRLTAVAELRQDITLHTKEGDVVTLSLNQDTAVVYGRDGRLSFQQRYREDGHGQALRQDTLAGEHREWFGLASNRASMRQRRRD